MKLYKIFLNRPKYLKGEYYINFDIRCYISMLDPLLFYMQLLLNFFKGKINKLQYLPPTFCMVFKVLKLRVPFTSIKLII